MNQKLFDKTSPFDYKISLIRKSSWICKDFSNWSSIQLDTFHKVSLYGRAWISDTICLDYLHSMEEVDEIYSIKAHCQHPEVSSWSTFNRNRGLIKNCAFTILRSCCSTLEELKFISRKRSPINFLGAVWNALLNSCINTHTISLHRV